MLLNASLTLLALLGSAVLALSGVGSRLAVAHLAFAVGIVPLIFAAMSHFVPVLTRSGGAEPAVHRLPLVLQAAGAAVVAVLAGWAPGWALHGALLAGLVTALSLRR